MNIFDILKNLFTNPSCDWVNNVPDKNISPPVIQRFLVLHNLSAKKARILNKFVFTLSPRMYLSAAWSILFFNGKKMSKAPFIKYPKKKKQFIKYDYIYDKVKRQFELSERDFQTVKPFIENAIEHDKVNWFCYYGVHKQKWFENAINIDMMKDYGDRPKPKKGLDAFF